tara:strand:- start:293 stop:751 length:459 start_codon:yes stop_codon:yes gene_type:complete
MELDRGVLDLGRSRSDDRLKTSEDLASKGITGLLAKAMGCSPGDEERCLDRRHTSWDKVEALREKMKAGTASPEDKAEYRMARAASEYSRLLGFERDVERRPERYAKREKERGARYRGYGYDGYVDGVRAGYIDSVTRELSSARRAGSKSGD